MPTPWIIWYTAKTPIGVPIFIVVKRPMPMSIIDHPAKFYYQYL